MKLDLQGYLELFFRKVQVCIFLKLNLPKRILIWHSKYLFGRGRPYLGVY